LSPEFFPNEFPLDPFMIFMTGIQVNLIITIVIFSKKRLTPNRYFKENEVTILVKIFTAMLKILCKLVKVPVEISSTVTQPSVCLKIQLQGNQVQEFSFNRVLSGS
jgi:hypothetical protein